MSINQEGWLVIANFFGLMVRISIILLHFKNPSLLRRIIVILK
ncbi:hypothetical protein NOC27_626 [Nitrosococcus oceani AFC27]|nr:hypothetical protein NOC27_626 [Nitrosococcus oceani AFC27]